jgi:hypothetical protein
MSHLYFIRKLYTRLHKVCIKPYIADLLKIKFPSTKFYMILSILS